MTFSDWMGLGPQVCMLHWAWHILMKYLYNLYNFFLCFSPVIWKRWWYIPWKEKYGIEESSWFLLGLFWQNTYREGRCQAYDGGKWGLETKTGHVGLCVRCLLISVSKITISYQNFHLCVRVMIVDSQFSITPFLCDLSHKRRAHFLFRHGMPL